MSVNDESAASGKWIRCQLRPIRSFWDLWKRRPPMVMDSNTNAPIASAGLAQVTATAANFRYSGGESGRAYTQPVLVMGVPGLKPISFFVAGQGA